MNDARVSPIARWHILVLGLGVALAFVLPAHAAPPPASPTGATPTPTPGPAGVEPLPVEAYQARQDNVVIRAEPGFVYRELRRLMAGQDVEIDGRLADWLRVRGGGWVPADQVWTRAEAAAAPAKPTRLVVIRDGARVRERPAADAAVVNTLDADAIVEASARQGGWWSLSTGGWINEVVVRAQADPRAAPAAAIPTAGRPVPWVVAADSANIRSGRGTSFGVVRRLVRGDIVPVTDVIDGWAHVPGGWVRQDLLQPPAPRAAGSPAAGSPAASATSARPAGAKARRWSLMDLNGTVFEVYEIGNPGVVKAIRAEMKATGVLEADWTYLGLTIGVAAESPYTFRYSPDGNKVVVVDSQGQKYGNVFARGPVQRMPAHIRALLDRREIEPGERFDGILMFRPTLNVEDIRKVSMEVEGREQKFIASP